MPFVPLGGEAREARREEVLRAGLRPQPTPFLGVSLTVACHERRVEARRVLDRHRRDRPRIAASDPGCTGASPEACPTNWRARCCFRFVRPWVWGPRHSPGSHSALAPCSPTVETTTATTAPPTPTPTPTTTAT